MARIAPDANDVLVYLLNDGPTTFANTGTAGASANWTSYGTPVSGAQGLFGPALYTAGQPTTSNVDGAGGANDLLVTPNLSLSGWVFIKRYSSTPLELFEKQYRLNNWTSPFLTFGFQMTNSADGRCDLFITLNGTLQSVNTGTPYLIQQGKWTHIGGTWDGSTLRFYVNGSLANSAGFSGTIDYNTLGSRGAWFVAGITGTSTNQTGSAIFQDIRVANVVRPASYFANIYYNGIFVNG
jgi:concanavalin A-like lectin/glucanase superfamily protein